MALQGSPSRSKHNSCRVILFLLHGEVSGNLDEDSVYSKDSELNKTSHKDLCSED